jgi:hypothetical protein
MPPEALRQLPFGTAAVLLRAAPLLITDLRTWESRKDAAELKKDRATIEALLIGDGGEGTEG